MSSDGVVRAHRIWKRFRPDRQRALLRDEFDRLRAKLRGEPGNWAWALKDVSFDLAPGSAFALIGSNGSGKSTMLKILTRVMYPYAGSIEVTGRVGALIEVSAGIHPDLSGRENCFLYGSLLGLSRADVAARFDDIVAFGELEKAIDRPVKFYSSGMKMRLGFAVAAFLEPDVLLVDEVLAVGDAAFQQRCLERMRAVLAQGTTLVYVSHDLATVEAMCDEGLWLRTGEVAARGPIRSVLGEYRQWIESSADSRALPGKTRVASATVAGSDGDSPHTGGPFEVSLTLDSSAPVKGRVHLGISEGPATPITTWSLDASLPASTSRIFLRAPHLPLARGRYALWCAIHETDEDALSWQPILDFDVRGEELPPTPTGVVRLSPVFVPASWEVDG